MDYAEKVKTIIIANTAEAFLSPIGYIKQKKQRAERIRIENSLSQRALLWEGDDKVVVTPVPIPRALFEHNSRVLGLQNTVNASPAYQTESLSDNILGDDTFLTELEDIIRQNPGIQLTSYAYTRQLGILLGKLREDGLNVTATNEPVGAPDVVQELDSKSGFRQAVENIPGVSLPEGFITQDTREVIKRANKFLAAGRSCVIKANEGESGWGLLIMKKEALGDASEVQEKIRQQFKRDGIWQSRPIVVEEYIELDKTRGGGAPSSEMVVSDNSVELTYHCGQLFDKEGEFCGVALGKGVLGDDLIQRMEDAALRVGQKYQELGYRGHFDIDFGISKDDSLYALETNTRRTGGTHVYDGARRALGQDWPNHWIVSNDSFIYGDKTLPPRQIINQLDSVLYSAGSSKEGAILTLIDNQRPILGYIAIGESADTVKQLQNAIQQTFRPK